MIIAKLTEEDLKAFALKYKKRFEAVPLYPLNQFEIRDKFYEQARKEAVEILEQERKNCVEYRSGYIKNTLNNAIKRLRLEVFTEHGKGTIYVARKVVLVDSGKGLYEERDVMYFETYPEGVDKLNRINLTLGQISEFADYIPYMNQECLQLWKEASDLANIGIVRVDAETQQATEKANQKA